MNGIRRPYGTGHPGRRNEDGTGVSREACTVSRMRTSRAFGGQKGISQHNGVATFDHCTRKLGLYACSAR